MLLTRIQGEDLVFDKVFSLRLGVKRCCCLSRMRAGHQNYDPSTVGASLRYVPSTNKPGEAAALTQYPTNPNRKMVLDMGPFSFTCQSCIRALVPGMRLLPSMNSTHISCISLLNKVFYSQPTFLLGDHEENCSVGNRSRLSDAVFYLSVLPTTPRKGRAVHETYRELEKAQSKSCR